MDTGQVCIRCAIVPRILILSTTSNVPPDPSFFNTILLSSLIQEWTLKVYAPSKEQHQEALV